MPPTNTSFADAVDLGSLPADVTQTDINDGGVNYDVYYKFTAPASTVVIGAWGFSGNIGSGYRPKIYPYIGPAGSPTSILNINAQNIPIQFPVTAGQEYFLKFEKNTDTAGPESLRVRVEVAPNATIAVGDIIVNDDTTGFPLAVLSSSNDYGVKKFIKDIACGESGDILSDGTNMLSDDDNSGNVIIYDNQFNELHVVTLAYSTDQNTRIRAHKEDEEFWIGSTVGGNIQINSVTKNGVVDADLTLISGLVGGLAVNRNKSRLYISTGEFSLTNAPVTTWTLPGGVQVSDLAAGIAGYATRDIIVLEDDTILVAYNKTSGAPFDVIIKRYNVSGMELNSYTVDGNILSCILASAVDSPDSFWVWVHDVPASGNSSFVNIRVSDGTVLSTIVQAEYELGIYNLAETATPVARFGNSFSCPFFIMLSGPPAGLFKIVTSKRTDHNGTNDVAIPNPTFRTALLP